MANSKISALISATTPLAGTETLPVVQSSTTKQVSVANLTAGRAVSASSYTSTTGATFATSSGLVAIGAITPVYKLDVFDSSVITARFSGNGSGSADTRLILSGTGNGGANRGTTMLFQSPGSLSAVDTVKLLALQETASATANNASFVVQVANSGGTLTEYLRVNNAGNATLTAGNLVQGTAAKGINFTANTPAAGMTSQLLNWYEEGTYTPTDVSGASLSFTVDHAKYTRIGRLVTASVYLTYPTTASVLTAKISLPFASANYDVGSANSNSASSVTAVITIGGAASCTVRNSTSVSLTNANLSGSQILFTISYPV